MKLCTDCSQLKDDSEYYTNKCWEWEKNLAPYCKPCFRLRSKKYGQTERGKEHAKAKTYRVAAKYPEKAAARQLLRTAVSAGKIVKPTVCLHCNNSYPIKSIQGHHEDYSRPLDVLWLCQTCHLVLHGKITDKSLIASTNPKGDTTK